METGVQDAVVDEVKSRTSSEDKPEEEKQDIKGSQDGSKAGAFQTEQGFMEMLSSLSNRVKRMEKSEGRSLEGKVETLIKRLENVEDKVSKNYERCHGTEKKVNKIDRRTKAFQESLGVVQEKVSYLSTLQIMLNDFHGKVKKRDELNREVDNLHAHISQTQEAISTIEQVISLGEGCSDNKAMVAFAAKILDTTETYFPGYRLNFSNVLLNTSDGYDPVESAFRAPSNGLYFFIVSIKKTSGGELAINITHNAEGVASFGTSGNEEAQMCTSTLVAMAAGDQVWVELDGHACPTGTTIQAEYSNFVGFRLR